ncbi:hypothetical protein [Paraburkholderia terrae]|uniref:hypothetical protein n=1 Tax=Paraburkholderia terrae TaxID=311230 RepID=UPI002059A84F|nr:hypothetical protein [Paraburkholderia terrae]BDC37768.1 hypothetical protein PTKU15_10650 [Paraburkholderia terrae]
MYRIDDATAATSIPAPEAAGTEGYFTEGNPATGTPATKVRGSWLNMIQEELCAILAAAGIARSKTTYNQVNSALQKMYSPVVGTVRNLAMSVTAASATATLTADEIVVGAALGGQKYILPSFSKTINLATTGAGGMDTGSAPTSGFVALYAIYNPTTGTSALLATNASTLKPSVYGGANMPAGYTASALVSVWQTNGSGQLVAGWQQDRYFTGPVNQVLSTSTQQVSVTPLSISSVVPANARSVSGLQQVGSTTNAVSNGTLLVSSVGGGNILTSNNAPGAGIIATQFQKLILTTPQTIYYTVTTTAGTLSYQISITGYEI